MRILGKAATAALGLTLISCASVQEVGQVLGQVAGQVAGQVLTGQGQSNLPLTEADMAAGLKAALQQGAGLAVGELGRNNGFWQQPQYQIPLPKPVQKAEKMLRQFGAGAIVDDFHQSLNRAAEQAVPVAGEVLLQSIQQMTLTDAKTILFSGQNDAATQFFRRTASAELTNRFKPIVAKATAQTGVMQLYQDTLKKAGSFAALVPAPDLEGYVTDKALEALFTRIAVEEKQIRENPLARGSELLRRVFGAKQP
jgi:hypothetical protein